MSNEMTNMYREILEKGEFGRENTHTVSYPTGIDLFDYRNGKVEEDRLLLGLNGGKITTIVGPSGSGKSTFAMQSGYNIIKDIDASQLIVFDFERTQTISRIQGILGIDAKKAQEKIILLNSEISTEKMYKFLRAVANIKLKQKDKIAVDTGCLDVYGKPVYELPPTVALIDSYATMTPEEIATLDNTELGLSNMTGAQTAKSNNAYLKALLPVLEQANILLLIVNHVTSNISTGPIKQAAQVNYLGQSESIPGGSTLIFASDTLIKLQGSGKYEEDKEFAIKGFKSVLTLIKSKSNEAGRKIELVFNQSKGFDNILTNFLNLKSAGFLKGNGRAYYFEFDPNTKFTQKTFKEKYLANPEFAEKFDELSRNVLMEMVNQPDVYDKEMEANSEEIELIECIDKKKDIWKANDGKFYNSNGEEVEM